MFAENSKNTFEFQPMCHIHYSVDSMLMMQTADILFFVVDNLTRSTASMVEASYLAGEQLTSIACSIFIIYA